MRFGLLGRKLGHSYSPQIHSLLGNYEYPLYEKEPEEIEAFLTADGFDGMNVTIPYKETVMPYMSQLSDTARKIGSVNTVKRLPDGTLYGDNTDYYGFSYMLESAGFKVEAVYGDLTFDKPKENEQRAIYVAKMVNSRNKEV